MTPEEEDQTKKDEERIRAIVREESEESVKKVLGEFLETLRPEADQDQTPPAPGGEAPDMLGRFLTFLKS